MRIGSECSLVGWEMAVAILPLTCRRNNQMDSLHTSQSSAFHAIDSQQQRLNYLKVHFLELSLAHEQVKAAVLQKQLQGVYGYLASQQLWQPKAQKPIHRVSSLETLTSEDCESNESRTGQEAGYPSKVSCSPWTQTGTQQTRLVFRIETYLRRELHEAVPYTEAERKAKVQRYLLKSQANKAKKVINRLFEGRSATAKAKTRVNGRFVKSEEN